ncbi:hypothetical protein [Bradyrhizobium jicamae]|uniref:hypothetical protein n=1 Tax=Bradyrhizobium jicamae TaxID=280332 RepID=UPI00201218A1
MGEGRSVVGIDSLNDYYDPALKLARPRKFSNSRAAVRAHLDLLIREVKRDIIERVCQLGAQPRFRS